MRILLATDHYPPSIGGAQLQTRMLAHELSRRGHDVGVATVAQDQLAAVHVDAGVTIYGLKQLRTASPWRTRTSKQRHQPPFPDPVTVLELRRVVRDFRPDLVHSHGWFSFSCAAALVGNETPLVISARDYGYSCANRTLLRQLPGGGDELCDGPGLRKCVSCCSRFFGAPKGTVAALSIRSFGPLLRNQLTGLHSVSGYVKDIMRRDFLRADGQPIAEQVIHSMLLPEDGKLDEACAAALAQLPDEPFMLFVGALRREKGINELVSAYRLLEAPPPLVLVGTVEPDTPVFPPGVIVLNDFPHAAVLEAWSRALLGVFPSRLPEPLGTVVAEAMTKGVAVIGTRPGGHEDLIEDGISGLLVERGDIAALASALQRLSADPELRSRLGAAAQEKALSLGLAQIADEFEQFYAAAAAVARQ